MTAFSFITPRNSLLIMGALFTFGLCTAAILGGKISDHTYWLWSFAFSLLLAWWTRSDRVRREYDAPFEHEAMVFFAWPIVVPYYLYKTRGRKGLLWGVGILGFYSAPFIAVGVVYVFLNTN